MYYYYYYYYLLLLFGVFTIMYMKQNVFLGSVYSAAGVLLLYFTVMVHVMLFSMLNVLYWNISTFRCMCAVPKMAVFFSYLISCFPGVLLRHYLNDFKMGLFAPIVTFPPSTYSVFLFWCLYMFDSSRHPSWPLIIFSRELWL